MENIRIIYISPNAEDYCELYEKMVGMTDEEKIQEAYNNDDVELLGFDEFFDHFNSEMISDLGYIFYVKV